ncbi:MAG: DUF5050 domain-containing protein [Clostridiales bacterium]|nr:DUF5050 domain-containing protein [Clostridiales bacterium]
MAAVSKKLAARSIDAESVYNEAERLREGGNIRAALAKYNLLSGYKDAYEHAKALDTFVRFDIADGKFIKLGRKHYFLTKEAATAFSVNNPQQSAEAQQQQEYANNNLRRYALYEIIDNKPAEQPAVKGITELVTYFGGTLVYVKNGGALCIFNSEAQTPEETDTVIIGSKPGDIAPLYDDKGRVHIVDNKLFLRQKLTAVVAKEEKKGCFGGLFKKNTAPTINVVTKNNFCLAALNLVTGELETAAPELVDVHCIFGDEIFYNKITVEDGIERDNFYSYNCVSKETRPVLSKDTEIVDVIDDKVIYFMWTPNDYNKDLYALDLKTNRKQLLETNVLDYYGQIEGKAYYYVGNDDCKTLYRIAPDGTGKREISSNATYFSRVSLIRNI